MLIVAIQDPADNGVAFPGNRIPQDRNSPTGKAILNWYGLPNMENSTDPTFNHLFEWEGVRKPNDTTARTDYNINPNWKFFFRLVDNKNNQRIASGLSSSNNLFMSPLDWKAGAVSGAGTLTTVITPTLVNQFVNGNPRNYLTFIGAVVPGVGDMDNGIVQAGTPGFTPGLINSQGVRIEPPFGMAWTPAGPGGKTVVRVGGGMFHERIQGNMVVYQISNPPGNRQPRFHYGNVSNVASLGETHFPFNNRMGKDLTFGVAYPFLQGAGRQLFAVGRRASGRREEGQRRTCQLRRPAHAGDQLDLQHPEPAARTGRDQQSGPADRVQRLVTLRDLDAPDRQPGHAQLFDHGRVEPEQQDHRFGHLGSARGRQRRAAGFRPGRQPVRHDGYLGIRSGAQGKPGHGLGPEHHLFARDPRL